MYEENEMIVLFRVEGGTPCALEISGTRIPSLEPVHIALNTVSALTVLPEGLQAAVAFTRIRYAIAALFKKTREYRLGSSRFQEVEVEVARLEQELRELQNGSQEQTVATALLAECAAIREAVTAYQMGTRADAMDLTSRILAHEATMGLGRGTVQSLSRPRPSASSEEEDPQNASMTRRVPDITSPYQSRTARRVTRLMATMSSGGAGYEEAVHEAQTLSQMP
jgi:hypothetical protein